MLLKQLLVHYAVKKRRGFFPDLLSIWASCEDFFGNEVQHEDVFDFKGVLANDLDQRLFNVLAAQRDALADALFVVSRHADNSEEIIAGDHVKNADQNQNASLGVSFHEEVVLDLPFSLVWLVQHVQQRDIPEENNSFQEHVCEEDQVGADVSALSRKGLDCFGATSVMQFQWSQVGELDSPRSLEVLFEKGVDFWVVLEDFSEFLVLHSIVSGNREVPCVFPHVLLHSEMDSLAF